MGEIKKDSPKQITVARSFFPQKTLGGSGGQLLPQGFWEKRRDKTERREKERFLQSDPRGRGTSSKISPNQTKKKKKGNLYTQRGIHL